jgi:hypothetical protein
MTNDSNGLRSWLHDLVSPQTLVLTAAFIAGFVISWTTMGTRISVLETSSLIAQAIMQKQLDELKADIAAARKEEKADLREAVDDRNRRIEQAHADSDAADQRLWQDINQLRSALIEHITTTVHAHRGKP